jgi:pyruvate formate lyase activating enzyme
MNDLKATIFDIQRNSYVDGPGLRTTVFFKGCNLACAWCHNPESQSAKRQMLFYKNRCTGCGKCKEKCLHGLENCDFCGKCALYCPNDAREICGKEYSVDEVFEVIKKDRAFYENSGGGVTFSGGEPLLQVDLCIEIAKILKKRGVNIAIDTCGFVPRESFERILPYVDTFLYDIKAYDEDTHIRCTGRSNQIVLENLKFLDDTGCNIEIRIPYVPEYNDDQMEKIAKFLSPFKNIKKIRILSYHDYADGKYSALGIPNTLPKKTPTGADVAQAGKLIQSITNFVVLYPPHY